MERYIYPSAKIKEQKRVEETKMAPPFLPPYVFYHH